MKYLGSFLFGVGEGFLEGRLYDITVPLRYRAHDKTRHWTYFPVGAWRSEALKAAHPVRKEDRGGAAKIVSTMVRNARIHLPHCKMDDTSVLFNTIIVT